MSGENDSVCLCFVYIIFLSQKCPPARNSTNLEITMLENSSGKQANFDSDMNLRLSSEKAMQQTETVSLCSNYVLCVQARTLQTHFPSPTLTRSIGQ